MQNIVVIRVNDVTFSIKSFARILYTHNRARKRYLCFMKRHY